MDLSININCQISDPHHEAEIVHLLGALLPWMADNVQINSTFNEEELEPPVIYNQMEKSCHPPKCSCPGHVMPGVHHLVPCCDEPHVIDNPIEDLSMIMESLAPSSLAAHLDRDRPYDGQPHTDQGERGRRLVEGLTMRDIADCFIRACYESSGLPIEEWPGSAYDLPWDGMDIIAVSQNLTCNIEKYMGIYPNVPDIVSKE